MHIFRLMKRTNMVLTGIVTAGLALTLMSNDNGVTFAQAKDRTGSPVGLTTRCNGCHTGSSASFTVGISLRLKNALGIVVTTYVPGETYTFEVEITSTGAPVYGFQAVSLLTATNANAGTLNAGSSNTKIVTLSGRRYADHTAPSATGLFSMTWVAPAAGSGTVKFYSSGIGANNNGNDDSGDRTTSAASLTILEQIASGISENTTPEFSVYPNPAQNNLTLFSNSSSSSTVQIFSLDGKIVMNKNFMISNSGTTIDISSLEAGTYILKVNYAEGTSNTTKFIKQ